MVDMSGLLTLQGMLFGLMALGIFFRRRGIVAESFQKGMTELVIDLVLPCNIITSFQMEMTEEILRQTSVICMVSLVIQIVCWLLAHVLFRRCAPEKQASLQYGTICSNAGLLGTAVAEGIFGAQGVLLTAVYLIPQRIAMWTLGVSFFAEKEKRGVVKRVVTHPCIVAVFIGTGLLLTQWQMPAVLDRIVRAVGGCNTALSMFLIGMIMSNIHWRDFLDPAVLYYTAVRLIAIPFLVLAGCRAAGVTGLPAAVAVVMAAMPAGGTTAILAAKYDCDPEFAASCVTVSTLLSLAAIPLWCLLI